MLKLASGLTSAKGWRDRWGLLRTPDRGRDRSLLGTAPEGLSGAFWREAGG